MLACLPSLFVSQRVCSKPSIAAQPETNHQARKQSKNNCLKKKQKKGWVGGGVGVRDIFACAPLLQLKCYKMDTANPVHTPATPADLQASDDSPLLSFTAKRDYQSAVGSLIFLINCTLFDIAFATMQVARHMSSPAGDSSRSNEADFSLSPQEASFTPEVQEE